MKENFKRKVLKNGMTVIFEKRNTPIVSVAFAVKAGAANEKSREKGIHHFLEHTLFKGTEKRTTREISEEIEKKGGVLNAFTSEEITAFFCKMPSKHLGIALDVLSDVVKDPIFPEKEIDKERKVIFEEIKMYKDNPVRHVFEEIQKCLYHEPFGSPILGTTNTLKFIGRKELLEVFKKTFTPGNMVLCVVGDSNFNDIVKFAERNFNKAVGEINEIKIKELTSSKIEKRKGVDQANIVFAYHVPLIDDEKSYAAEILNTLMAEGMSSRLFLEIREKLNLAYAIKGYSEINKKFAYNLIYSGIKKENVEEVKKLILEEFKKVSKKLTEKELKQVKEQIIGNHKISMEDSQEQMINLISHEANGNAETFYDFEKNILNSKLEDVKEIAKKAIGSYSFFALIPE